jgi:hypothetical protein
MRVIGSKPVSPAILIARETRLEGAGPEVARIKKAKCPKFFATKRRERAAALTE